MVFITIKHRDGYVNYSCIAGVDRWTACGGDYGSGLGEFKSERAAKLAISRWMQEG